MENLKEKLIGKIGNNLRFVITISIFFLAIFSDTRLQGCIIIACYVIDYIVFEIRETKFSVRNLKWINTSLFIGIGSYIIPLAFIALSTQSEKIHGW